MFKRRCDIANKVWINEEIKATEVRVIDETGEQLGIIQQEEALDIAEEKELDLVNVSPNAKPPVCKILDYGKFKYDQQKREKEARKKQKTIQVKEIRLSAAIEEHDIDVKAKRACKFLEAGDKVKVMFRFRGRERSHKEVAYAVLEKFAKKAEEFGEIEKKPTMDGRALVMMLMLRSE